MEVLDVFKKVAQEFIEYGDDTINIYLELADEEISKSISEHTRTKMVAFLAAHYMDIAYKRKGAGAQVTSVSEGKLSINYAANNKIDSDYDLSSYGRMYKQLVKSCIITPMTRVC